MGSEEELVAVKKAKKSKKEKKRKREDDDKDAKREERKRLKAQKKAEKEEVLSKVPKVDEHGIAYTKIQIKRMVKRVSRGLDPIETEEEKRKRLRERKREEMETKDELAGMIFRREEKDSDREDEEDSNHEDEVDEEKDFIDYENEKESDAEKDDSGDDENEQTAQCIPAQRKKPRSKPVPDDYVCYACKNAHQPRHWIYDCPDKIYQPGYREVKKNQRGINEPSSRKVFVTGLPFDAKTNDVKAYFEKEMKCGKVTNCKLFVFEDTKRCKGNGILSFQSDEGARKALKLDGTKFDLDISSGDGKKTKKTKKSKTSLWLGVKKMRDRSQTKKK